jgi:hypothetical protein
MNARNKTSKKKLSQGEIDQLVVEQANDDSAWDEPVHVRQSKPSSFSLPADLASRAAFLAKLHKETGVEKWLVRVIRERIELEEVAFVEAKRELALKSG